ncbi:MAG: sensor histidine kinase [Bacteroidales bacterium]|nr:sensor histidine kinase [Bacteroidales bacterium]
MKILPHKNIAIRIALVGLLTAVIVGVVLYFLHVENPFIAVATLAVCEIVVLYFVSRILMKSFIVEKIRPIYKIIRSAQMPKFKELVKSDENLLETASKDAEEWAARKSEELEQLKKQELFRKEYIGNVAHELKTPIFTIQGYVSTLLDGGLYDESINRKYLERSDKVIQRMTSIVNDLDAINRLESGELKMEYTAFNIVDLVNEIFESQEYLAKERNVTLSLELTYPKNTMVVYADRMRISMALSNLIVNAIKYNKPEGGSVRVRFFDMDRRFLVEVSDTGIGIPQDCQGRIFERFFRVDKSRSREQGGTGLGLAIVKHVVEAHGETINMKSTLNKGTSFSFTIKKGVIQ